jgi:uncharacterized secreted protein with C-terminal beta-propeller domain
MNGIIKIFGLSLLVLLLVFSFGCVEKPETPANNTTTSAQLMKFNSSEDLMSFLEAKTISGGYRYYDAIGSIGVPMQALSSAPKAAAESGGSTDYSTTNIQVAGVDEADIVKTDGKYIYVLSGTSLIILQAYPAENATILSQINLSNPNELYVNGDSLVVFDRESYKETTVLQYDITDRSNPILTKNITAEGNYFDSRMIDNFVYVLVNKPVYYYYANDTIEPPTIQYTGVQNTTTFPDVYYFDEPAYSYRFTTVLSIDLNSTEERPESKIFLMGTSQDLYVSRDNIYVTYRKVSDFVALRNNPLTKIAAEVVPMPPIEYKDETAVHRIAIKDGEVEYAASGVVPGHILNQFSMDEHNGYFRVATTSGHVSRSAEGATSKNNVYVLDSNLNITGKLEDLAPGERIYSARFMGNRSYLVTFKKVDPLFVIDMQDPTEPKVLGKLKIPGYSNYLHPYDENHLIGIGKETVEAEVGDFAWYQGVKISLFDVTDVSAPKELSKYEIGDRGTDSYALYDHKAFLFSKDRNLLVIPILLAQIDEERFSGPVPSNAHGDYTFQGAYVFNISSENGIKLRGRITHVNDSSSFEKSGYYYYSPYSVKRSLYMDDVLYTISNRMVKMNKLDDLSEVNNITLPYHEEAKYWYYYE